MKFEQSSYWNTAGLQKEFSHPVKIAWLEGIIDQGAAILDFGCGYGRICKDLKTAGYENVIGIDSSRGLVEKGKSLYPVLDLRYSADQIMPFSDGTIDLICLFAVLTSVPYEEDQRQMVRELHRLLRPGGHLYVSDCLLNPDERNLKRYQEHLPQHGKYGIFETSDGGVFVHHEEDYLSDQLLQEFEISERAYFEVVTMNKNTSRAIQLLAKKK